MAVKLPLRRGSYVAATAGVGRLTAAAGDAIATGVTNNYDVDVSDFDCVSVLAALTGAVLGDLGLTVQALDSTGTPVPIALTPAVTSPAQVFASGKAYGVQQYDVRGLQGIRVAVKNNNAGAQTVTFVDVLASITGVDF